MVPVVTESEPELRDATPSMVIGIVGAALGLLFFVVTPFVPLLLGIIGLVLARNRKRDGKRTAGLVLGIINTSLGAIGSVWFIYALAVLNQAVKSGY